MNMITYDVVAMGDHTGVLEVRAAVDFDCELQCVPSGV